MLQGLKSFTVPATLVFAVGSLVACTSEPPRRSASAGENGGQAGEGGSGGSGGSGAGKRDDAGGGGSPAADAASGGGSDAAAAPSDTATAIADASSDIITHAIPGFALCVVCHGAMGEGLADKGPEIQHPVIDFSTWVVRNGRQHPTIKDPMPKFTDAMLSEAQLQGIFAFLAGLPKPTTGKALYEDYCQNCHGADAKGGITMRPIDAEPVATFIADTRAGHHPGEFANRREFMPKWSAAELTDAQIRLIFMYVSGL